MPKTARTATATIWTTAKLTDVNRRHRRIPARAMTLGPAWPAGRPVARSVGRPIETLVKARRCYTALGFRPARRSDGTSPARSRRPPGRSQPALSRPARSLRLPAIGGLRLRGRLDGEHQRLRGRPGDAILATALGGVHRAVGADQEGIGGAA